MLMISNSKVPDDQHAQSSEFSHLEMGPSRIPALLVALIIVATSFGLAEWSSGVATLAAIDLAYAAILLVLYLAYRRLGTFHYLGLGIVVPGLMVLSLSAYITPDPGFLWSYLGIISAFNLVNRNTALILCLPFIASVVHAVQGVLSPDISERLPMTLLITTGICYLAAYRLERSEKKILDFQRELVNANRLQKDFIDNVSHEMRTPLTTIKGYTEIMMRDADDSQVVSDCGTTILASTRQLTAMVDDLIDTTKLEAGSLTVSSAKTDVATLLNEIIDSQRENARRAGLEIRLQPNFPLPKYLVTDRCRVTQVLLNLIENGIKHTPSGHVELTVELSDTGNTIVFAVRDTGTGVAPEFHDRLFDRFSQGGGVSPGVTGGVGLGLHISKELAELLGGKLEYRPLDQGSEFSLELPVSAEYPERISNLQAEEVACNSDLARPENCSGHVLIAEDSETNRMLLEMLLESFGLNHSAVSDGAQAVEAVSQSHYDLVLMDINMPVMTGIEATRQIKESSPDVPIVAISASAVTSRRDDPDIALFDDVLGKPINNQKLASVLKRFLARNIKDRTDTQFVTQAA